MGVLAAAVGLPMGSAEASGGRVEAARTAVRPAAPASRPPASSAPRPPSTAGAPVRVHVLPPPVAAAGPRPGVRVYTVVRRRPAPPAVPPPQALGPEREPLDLQGPPPRPPFERFVNRWPYEARRPGYVADPWTASGRDHRRVAGRLSAEGAYLYKGLWRTGVAARVGSARVDVDTQLSFYLDAPRRDGLYLGDTSLNIAPVALPQLVWRVGLGARYMLDARLPGAGPREHALGWNFSTSLDAFPGRPFVISARLDRGTLYQTAVWRGRATVGLVRERFELFAGYEHTQIERVALGGPLVGLRAWL